MSPTQYRTLRKELLILRCDVERLELVQAGAELKHSVTRFKWLKYLVPGLARGPFAQAARSLDGGLLGTLVGQHPLASSLVSAVLAKPVRSLLRPILKPALKWGTLALAGWELYRIWTLAKRDRDESAGADENAQEEDTRP